MNALISNRVLQAAAVLLLFGGLIATLMVGERTVAALWQWYKFADYSGDGYVTLGIGPGVALIAGCSAMALASLLILRSAKASQQHDTARVALVAAIAGAAPLLIYVVLLVGPLAMWRA